MSPDDIDAFVFYLSEYLNKQLPPEKYMGDFFDTDANYISLQEFVEQQLERFVTRDRNYN